MGKTGSVLEFEQRDGFGVATLHIGKITGHEAESIGAHLAEAAQTCSHRLILDMRHVMMLASAALGALISTQQQCTGAGGTIALVQVSSDLEQLLKITKLHKIIPVERDVEHAAARVFKVK